MSSRSTEEELFISERALVPPGEEQRLHTVNQATLLQQLINRCWPKSRDQLDDPVRAIHNALVGSEIPCELEPRGVLLGSEKRRNRLLEDP